jgi:hypothetical protein
MIFSCRVGAACGSRAQALHDIANRGHAASPRLRTPEIAVTRIKIDEIAELTNLLALNAAIEASREAPAPAFSRCARVTTFALTPR